MCFYFHIVFKSALYIICASVFLSYTYYLSQTSKFNWKLTSSQNLILKSMLWMGVISIWFRPSYHTKNTSKNSWTHEQVKRWKKFFFEVTHWSKWLIDVLLLFIWYLLLCLLIFLAKNLNLQFNCFQAKLIFDSLVQIDILERNFDSFMMDNSIHFMLLQT